MRQATAETRRALREAVAAAPSQNAWANVHGLSPATVSNVRRGRSCSVATENAIRASLDLPPLSAQLVEIDETQAVIKRRGHGKPRPPRVDVYVTADQLAALRAMAERNGISVPELMRQSALRG